jgi:hypothetical protein
MQEKLQEFAVSMGSISQIYFHILNIERRRFNLLPKWRRFFLRRASKRDIFMKALARMSDLDIAKITKDALGYPLPQFQQATSTAHEQLQQKGNQDDSTKSYRRSGASATLSNLPPNMAGVPNVPSPDDDLQMTGMGASSPGTGVQAADSPEQSKNHIQSGLSQTLGLNRSGVSTAKGKERRPLPLDTADKSPGRAISRRGLIAEASACTATTPSFVAADAVRKTTTIGSLALHRRVSAVPKLLVAAAPKPVQAADEDARLRRVGQDSSQTLQKTEHALESELSSHLTRPLADGAVGVTIIPQPPPRSRSCSRTRPASESASVAGATKVDAHFQQSLASHPGSTEGGRASGQVSALASSLPDHSSSSLPKNRPSKVAHAPRHQLSDVPPPSSTKLHTHDRRAAIRAAHSALSLNVSAAVHSAQGADSADISVTPESLSNTSQEPNTSAAVLSPRTGGGIAASSASQDVAHRQRTAAAASSGRSSKKQLSARELRVKTLQEQFADRLEEC